MNTSDQNEKSLKEIREIMERSATFISLSGASGVISGLLALAGVFYLHSVFGSLFASKDELTAVLFDSSVRTQIYIVFLTIFILSVAAAFILSSLNAKKKGLRIFNGASKNFAFSLLFPIVTAAFMIPALINEEQFWLIIPATLIFYGTALLSSSKYSRKEISQIGLSCVLCGLLALYYIEFSFLLWGIGFGVNNILAGLMLYIKYERSTGRVGE
jgi:hypothetical protein